jgi:hypothetical protein
LVESPAEDAPVIVLESDPALARTLARIVEAVGGHAVPTCKLGDALDAARDAGARLLLASYGDTIRSIDGADLTGKNRGVLEGMGCKLCLMQGDERPRSADFARLLDELPLDHWIATPLPALADEISLMVAHLLRGGILGLEKYLAPSLLEEHVELSAPEEKPEALERMQAYLTSRGQEARLISRTHGAADEIVFNALGQALASAVEPEGRSVSLRYGTDGHFIGFCVRDRVGALAPETVRASLSRGWLGGPSQVRLDSPGGAGIGLFLAHQYLDRLVFNVTPGERTEIIGIVDTLRASRPARFASSFHLFSRPLTPDCPVL